MTLPPDPTLFLAHLLGTQTQTQSQPCKRANNAGAQGLVENQQRRKNFLHFNHPLLSFFKKRRVAKKKR